jgi:hypothetical protein
MNRPYSLTQNIPRLVKRGALFYNEHQAAIVWQDV